MNPDELARPKRDLDREALEDVLERLEAACRAAPPWPDIDRIRAADRRPRPRRDPRRAGPRRHGLTAPRRHAGRCPRLRLALSRACRQPRGLVRGVGPRRRVAPAAWPRPGTVAVRPVRDPGGGRAWGERGRLSRL